MSRPRLEVRSSDEELAKWRAAAAVRGIRDLATWVRMLATAEVRRVRSLMTADHLRTVAKEMVRAERKPR